MALRAFLTLWVFVAGCGDVVAEPPRDAGVDGRARFADAPLDVPAAPICAQLAVDICARMAACPGANSELLCYEGSPDGLCFGSLDLCVASFTSCYPTATPPSGYLTFLPDPAACLAVLPSLACVQQGGPGTSITLPASCATCSLPDGSLTTGAPCIPLYGDGG
jgi:hypothetical protein